VLQIVHPQDAFFWATHNGAELDLLLFHKGKRYGIEVKFSEAPEITQSMQTALHGLDLTHLWVIYPGKETYQIEKRISIFPIQMLSDLPATLS
jgi:predicted AAA+ superfamily ATPase